MFNHVDILVFKVSGVNKRETIIYTIAILIKTVLKLLVVRVGFILLLLTIFIVITMVLIVVMVITLHIDHQQ